MYFYKKGSITTSEHTQLSTYAKYLSRFKLEVTFFFQKKKLKWNKVIPSSVSVPVPFPQAPIGVPLPMYSQEIPFRMEF